MHAAVVSAGSKATGASENEIPGFLAASALRRASLRFAAFRVHAETESGSKLTLVSVTKRPSARKG
jgi:hypothetical protein